MTHNYAANWFAAKKERLEKSKKASKEVMDSSRPMVERKRQILLKEKLKQLGVKNMT